MLVSEPNAEVGAVRCRLTEARAAQSLRLWSDNGALTEGEGRRGLPAGVLLGGREVEKGFLKEHFDEVLWSPQDFTFIGENAGGDHLRVDYSPGALAPAAPV